MIIYKATNKVNGKIYIGQTIKTLDRRIKGHINDSRNGGNRFKNAIKKYGRENFKWEVIEECQTIEQLNEREEYWIRELNSTNIEIGYNMKNGGKNHLLNEEIKEK
jgi:GIY-YIG catalytic domain.